MPAKRKTLQDEVAEVMAVGAAPPAGLKPVTTEDLAADAAFLDDEAPEQPLGDDPAAMPEATVTEATEPTKGEAVDARPAAVADAAPVRGGVNALVTRLLSDPDLSYEAIVARVVAEFPGAQTSARSVASTASVLRRKGTPVPMRRK